MAHRIYKYPLPSLVTNDITFHALELPFSARILNVLMHDGRPVLYAFVDTEAPLVRRYFGIYGIGWDIPPDPGQYIGTVHMDHGNLVWNIFEVTTPC